MKVVIADTSPINYLILINCVDLLRELYAHIIIPSEVFEELTSAGAPPEVAAWVRSRPEWVEVRLSSIVSRVPLALIEADLERVAS